MSNIGNPESALLSDMRHPSKAFRAASDSSTSSSPAINPKPRRRGRPRKDEMRSSSQAAEILDVAIELFAKNGYRSTTMSQIAEAAGYGQSSLYYWYKRKEDLLRAIVEKTGFSLQTAARISALKDDKTAQLYAVLYSDTFMMCDLPCDFHNLEDVALDTDGILDDFFLTYQQLLCAVRLIIEDGIEGGEFVDVISAEAACDALSLNEGLQHRFHQTIRSGGESNKMIEPELYPLFRDKSALAHHAAASTVCRLAPNCNIDQVRTRAMDNNWI